MGGQKFLRGQVWWWEPQNKETNGNLQNSNRPCLIVGNNKGNKYSPILLIVTCTTEDKKYMPTHVKFEMYGKENTLLCEQIRTINTNELGDYVYTLDEETMKEVDECLKVALGLETKQEEIKGNWPIFDIKVDKNKKGRIWTDEMKMEYIKAYEEDPEKAKEDYDVKNNYKSYYRRFTNYFKNKGEYANEKSDGNM